MDFYSCAVQQYSGIIGASSEVHDELFNKHRCIRVNWPLLKIKCSKPMLLYGSLRNRLFTTKPLTGFTSVVHRTMYPINRLAVSFEIWHESFPPKTVGRCLFSAVLMHSKAKLHNCIHLILYTVYPTLFWISIWEVHRFAFHYSYGSVKEHRLYFVYYTSVPPYLFMGWCLISAGLALLLFCLLHYLMHLFVS
jgi:hypothetical protein